MSPGCTIYIYIEYIYAAIYLLYPALIFWGLTSDDMNKRRVQINENSLYFVWLKNWTLGDSIAQQHKKEKDSWDRV